VRLEAEALKLNRAKFKNACNDAPTASDGPCRLPRFSQDGNGNPAIAFYKDEACLEMTILLCLAMQRLDGPNQ
jgi:hypothetical protein